jgi:lambda repressor-like predicted transcriptional regulator
MRDFLADFDCANYDEVYAEVQNELKNMYWYDKKVWEIIESGESIAELSRKSGIPYYSLYNTYKKVKEKLKKNINI